MYNRYLLDYSLLEELDISLISAQLTSRVSVSDHSDELTSSQKSQFLFLPTKGSQSRIFELVMGQMNHYHPAKIDLSPFHPMKPSIESRQGDSTIRSLND